MNAYAISTQNETGYAYGPILADPAALANMDIFGAHLYGTQVKDCPYLKLVQKGAGKELWMAEVSCCGQ